MTTTLRTHVEQTIADCLRKKLAKYKPESKAAPFHYRLIGRDRMALFSFIHSLNTSFGVSIFEPVAKAIASERFDIALTQHTIGKTIYDQSQAEISSILDSLRAGSSDPDKSHEIELLKQSLSGSIRDIKPTKADLYLEDKNGNRKDERE